MVMYYSFLGAAFFLLSLAVVFALRLQVVLAAYVGHRQECMYRYYEYNCMQLHYFARSSAVLMCLPVAECGPGLSSSDPQASPTNRHVTITVTPRRLGPAWIPLSHPYIP